MRFYSRMERISIKGQIRKALSGFYYVLSEEDGVLYQTRGRGQFRVKKQTPLVGDFVSFDSGNTQEGVLLELFPRKNELVRPPIANVDVALVVASAVEPQFSPQLIDRFLITLEKLDIEPILYVSKCDLQSNMDEVETWVSYYRSIGYTVVLSSQKDCLKQLKNLLVGKLTVLMGQSGAGKSTLLNTLWPHLKLQTAEISTHLGRGKHTTRHVEIHEEDGCLVADTPGFSAIDFFDIEAEELSHYFVDFTPLSKMCQYRGCVHIDEPKCHVKNYMAENAMFEKRYTHYLSFYQEIKGKKKIYQKKK